MASRADSANAVLASNRKARRDYAVVEKLEAGIALRGTEVKSVRAGQVSLSGGFARVEQGQVWLYNVTIQPYDHGNQFNHDPERRRRLLLHRREIRQIEVQTEQKGCTLVPLDMHTSRGRMKVLLGVCRGKTHGDKRETIKRRDSERDAQRAMARYK